MGGPWEDYGAAPLAAGPWADYAPVKAPAPKPRTSQALGFAKGVVGPLSKFKYLNPMNALSGTGMEDRVEANVLRQIKGVEASGVRPGMAGEVVGNVLATAPTAVLGPIAGGAAAGALMSNAKDAKGLALDTALGAAGGKAGDMAVRGVQRVISPVVDAGKRALLDAGVTLTPGQLIGGIAKKVEDSLTSVPVIGDMISGAQRRGVETFNRAVIAKALKPIGASLPDNVPTGSAAIKHAGDTLSAAYKTVLPTGGVAADKRFTVAVMRLAPTIDTMTPPSQAQLQKIIESRVVPRFDGAGKLTGQAFKKVESELDYEIGRFSKSQDADQQAIGQALTQFRDALRDAAARQNPAFAAHLAKINRGWAEITRAETAAARAGAEDGIFTPKQYEAAIRSGDKSVRRRAVARGEALGQEFASAGSKNLTSKTPDSGTAGRLLNFLGLSGIAGLAVTNPAGLVAGAGGVAAASLPYTKVGQKVVTNVLANRPAGAAPLAKSLNVLRLPARLGAGIAATAPTRHYRSAN